MVYLKLSEERSEERLLIHTKEKFSEKITKYLSLYFFTVGKTTQTKSNVQRVVACVSGSSIKTSSGVTFILLLTEVLSFESETLNLRVSTNKSPLDKN